MHSFHYIFDGPCAQPTSSSPLTEVFAWTVWIAMAGGLSDVILEETPDALVVAGLRFDLDDEGVPQPQQVSLASFRHLRGRGLRELPKKASGWVSWAGERRWVRFWSGPKRAGDRSACAIVRLQPSPPPGLYRDSARERD